MWSFQNVFKPFQYIVSWDPTPIFCLLLSYFSIPLGTRVEDISSTIMLFLLLWALKSRESGGRLSYDHTFSNTLNIQVQRQWRASQRLLYFFSCFGFSSQEKIEDVSAVILHFEEIYL